MGTAYGLAARVHGLKEANWLRYTKCGARDGTAATILDAICVNLPISRSVSVVRVFETTGWLN
jgi:hypothetical protein